MEEWYNVTELSEKSGIAEPSVRRYLSKFSPYFVSKGGARAKRYDPAAIKVLLRIKQLFEAGYETKGVEEALRLEFPVIIDDQENKTGFEKPITPTIATNEAVAELKQAVDNLTKIVLEERAARIQAEEEAREFKELVHQLLISGNMNPQESAEEKKQPLLESGEENQEMVSDSVEEKPEEPKKKGFFKRLFKS